MKKFIYALLGLVVLGVTYWGCGEKLQANDLQGSATALETRARCNDIGYNGLLCAAEDFRALQAEFEALKASLNKVNERLTIEGKNFSSVPGWTAVNAKSGAEVKYDVAENGAVYWPKTAKGYTGFNYIFFNSAGTAAIEFNPDAGTITFNDKGVKHVLKIQ